MNCNNEETLWVEKYRPSTIKDCILKKSTKREFNDIIKNGKIPNLLFFGNAGSGKTTAAKALCNQIGLDWILINASSERGIDTIRDTIRGFASSVSLSGNGKCIICDESDGFGQVAQAGVRGVIEEFSKSCSFIFTANYPNKLIPALHSRLAPIDFNADPNELEEMQARFYMRVVDILNNENIEYDDASIASIVQKYFPDNRKILNILQQYSRNGKIDEGILLQNRDVDVDELVKSLKAKKFKDIANWAEQNKQNDTAMLYEMLYKTLRQEVDSKCLPDVILTIADYQRYDSVVPSKELHLTALCTELMMNVEFKK